MKLIVFIITFLLSFFAQADDDVDKYNPEQKAVLKIASGICHAEYVGSYYAPMYLKVDGTTYISFDSLRECIVEGGRLDKRYARRFPELSLLETQFLKEEKKADLLSVLIATSPTVSEIEKAQRDVETVKELETVKQKEIDKTEKKEEKESQDTYDFYGFNWAPGIAVMSYDSPYISDIRIDSTGTGEDQINTVYIDREVDTNIAIGLETHYLWETKYKVANRRTGWGIFATTNLAKKEGDPLTVFGLGPMFAVKNKDSSSGFSIGLAYFVDTDFKVLRDDLHDGSTTTFTDSSKITRTVDETGWMLMISSKF